jgi:hypothetical protein
VEALMEEKRYFECAVITALVKGCCWAEAARMMRKADRADLDGQC